MNFYRINTRKAVDYLLMFLLISISGNPFFSGEHILIGVFFYSFYIFIKRKNIIPRKFFYFFVLLVIITVLQSLKFSFFPIVTLLGIYIRVLTAYLVVRVIDFKFIDRYVKTLYAIAITSLIFYLISNIAPNVLTLLSFDTSSGESIYARQSIFGLFTFVEQNIHRNSGSFWEPGAFGGYLVLAFIFNFFSHLKNKKKIGIVLIITILTTMSTTAYLAIFLFSFLVYYKKINNAIIKIIAVSVILLGGYYSFIKIDFLGEKITKQVLVLNEDVNLENAGSARFLSLLKDIEDFKGHEIIGRGFHSKTRYLYQIENQIRTVGLTDIIVKMGLPFFIIIMCMLYYSLTSFLNFNYNNKKIFIVGSFLVIITLLMSQVYFNYPFFWSILFLNFVYTKKKRTINVI